MLFLSITGLLLTTTACSSNSQPAFVNKDSKSTSTQKKTVKTSTKKEKNGATVASSSSKDTGSGSINSTSAKQTDYWNGAKATALSKFMDQWQETMDQQYASYTPAKNVNFYGLKYPDELAQKTTAVDDQQIPIEWSDTGRGNKDYEVVAVYSDAEYTHNMSQHLYLFVLHDGEPEVLITQQNQGMPDHLIHFKQTENTVLSTGFANIVKGRSATVPSSSKQSKSSSQNSALTVPAALKRTWYGYDDEGKLNTVTITADTLTSSGSKIYLHTRDANIDPSKEPQHDDWASASTANVRGINFLNIRGWNQTAGAGESYGVKQENVDGQNIDVMIEAGGAGVWCSQTYYTSADLAKKQQGQKYDDIIYYDDAD
ncbi:lipoprotein precursor [Liquorilactobacillus capillatus DSM 19910]|uniref:Lipoprotein n=2 Tax=Liquorilactobacillus capillatus TaxID=480931 RepID=A0A0R1MBN4_9LACO|nr:lipoprotein precursor [Liquorilactobacillus capillatus DSM 19910]